MTMRRIYRNLSGRGNGCAAKSVAPRMGGCLYKMALAMPSSPRREKPEPRPPGKSLPMTDEQILEARVEHERKGADADTLAERYGVAADFMRRVLDYRVRCKLFPPLR